MSGGEARPLAAALLVVVGAGLLAFALLGPPFYDHNDDPVMSTIVSGVGWVAGETHPSPRAVFVHLLLGKALVALYASSPAVPWYGAMLLAGVGLAASTLAFAGLRLAPPPLSAALVGLLAAIVALAGASLVNFGVVASLLGGAALALGASLTARPAASAGLTGVLAGAAFLIGLFGVLLRPESCWLAAATLAPLLALVVQRRGIRASLALLAGLLVLALAHAGLRSYERRDYAGARGWEETFEWMEAGQRVLDYSAIVYDRDSAPAFAEAGWSANDFDQLRGRFVADQDRYSAASLRRFHEILRRHGAVAPASLGEGRLHRALVTPFSLAALALGCLAAAARPRREAAVLALGVPWAVGLLAGVAVLFKAPPPRVHLPVWLLAMAVPVLWCAMGAAAPVAASRRARVVGALALAALMASGVVYTIQARQVAASRERSAASARRDLERLAPYRGGLLLNWAGLFPVHDLLRPLDPFRDRSGRLGEYGRHSFYWLGWPTRLPINQLWLERQGLRDLYGALYERGDLLILARPEYLPFVERDILEHRGIVVGHERVMEGETVSAYRLVGPGRRAPAANP